MTVETAVKVPLRERINFRILFFALVVLVLVGYPLYWYLETELTGGIKQVGDLVEVDLKAMSSFAFDQNNGTIDAVPKEYQALNGKRVILYGEMYAPASAGESIETFDLVYSISKCCLSGPPQIQHFVHSRGVNGSVGYYTGLVKVVGTLRVNVTKAHGKVDGVYWLDVESTEPVR